MILFTGILFYVLTPGILLSLPSKGSKMVVAATHALVFALVYSLTYKIALELSMSLEGFKSKRPIARKSGFQDMMDEDEDEYEGFKAAGGGSAPRTLRCPSGCQVEGFKANAPVGLEKKTPPPPRCQAGCVVG